MTAALKPRWSFRAPSEAAIGAFLTLLRAGGATGSFSYLSIELHEDGSVWYDLRAFSRPRYWPVRIGKRIARRLQARFVRESQASMRAVASGVATANRSRQSSASA